MTDNSVLTPEFLADLKAKAEKATPGKRFWARDKHNQATNLMTSGAGAYVLHPEADVGNYALSVNPWIDATEDDLAFIEFVDPAVILSLLAALEEAEGRIKRQDLALAEACRAIGDHFSPNDCYATGPLTGDAFLDLVECPACSFINMHAALSPVTEEAK